MSRKRRFDKDFKLQVVRRSLEQDVSVKQLAEELDIAVPTISRWRKEFLDVGGPDLAFPGHGKQALSEQQQQIRQLQAKLKDKELELEVLKKAIRIFSKEGPNSTRSFR